MLKRTAIVAGLAAVIGAAPALATPTLDLSWPRAGMSVQEVPTVPRAADRSIAGQADSRSTPPATLDRNVPFNWNP
jgi:hypothetical protein